MVIRANRTADFYWTLGPSMGPYNTTDIETRNAAHLPRLERSIVVNTLHVSFLHCPNEEIYPSNESLVTALKCIDPNVVVFASLGDKGSLQLTKGREI